VETGGNRWEQVDVYKVSRRYPVTIMEADTPFLLCLADIDILKVYYNNLKNVLVTLTKLVLVVC